MSNIYDIHKIVLEKLICSPRARKDDAYLFAEVCDDVCPGVWREPFWKVMTNCPVNYETVRRARQKIQAENPELRDTETAEKRAEKIPEYVGYARS